MLSSPINIMLCYEKIKIRLKFIKIIILENFTAQFQKFQLHNEKQYLVDYVNPFGIKSIKSLYFGIVLNYA
jgi:hypothetical protein